MLNFFTPPNLPLTREGICSYPSLRKDMGGEQNALLPGALIITVLKI